MNTHDEIRHVTVEQLNEKPKIVDELSLDEIKDFRTRYYRKHIGPIRRYIDARESLINKAEKERARLEKLYRQIAALYHRIQHIHLQPDVEKFIHEHGRSIGNDIHDLIVVWTGKESKQSIAERERLQAQGKKYEHCDEHFWPRQWAGIQIANLVLKYKKDFNMCILAEHLHDFCHVHRVTAEENGRLIQYQKVHVFTTPDECYKLAEIDLEQVEDYKGDATFSKVLELIRKREKC